jgi:hypothetical protein
VSILEPLSRGANRATPAWLPENFRSLFLEILESLPAYPDRRTAARVWTKRVHPLSPRTLEAWPLQTRRLNGRACLAAQEFVEYGFRRLLEAPAIQGGRRGTKQAS